MRVYRTFGEERRRELMCSRSLAQKHKLHTGVRPSPYTSHSVFQNLGDVGLNPIPPCPVEKVGPAMCNRFTPDREFVPIVPPWLVSTIAVALLGLASRKRLSASIGAEY